MLLAAKVIASEKPGLGPQPVCALSIMRCSVQANSLTQDPGRLAAGRDAPKTVVPKHVTLVRFHLIKLLLTKV